jgi:hypothetical protein
VNHKKLYRLYKEERLTVRKRGGRKRALGTWAPMTIPQGSNQRWSLDFVSAGGFDDISCQYSAFDYHQKCIKRGLTRLASLPLAQGGYLERGMWPQRQRRASARHGKPLEGIFMFKRREFLKSAAAALGVVPELIFLQ